MTIVIPQNFYRQTITRAVTLTGATNIYLSAHPTPAEGYLHISPASATLREIIYYTAKGTDGNGTYVTVTLTNRGLGGTTAQTHAIGESVRMNVGAETIQDISDAMDQIVAGGAQDAATTTKGISKLSVAPASATEPIAVGTNDPRVPSALISTSAGAADTGKSPILDAAGKIDKSFLNIAIPQFFATSINGGFETPAMGSNSTGSVIYVQTKNAGYLHRFEKDAITGVFLETHAVDTAAEWSATGSDTLALIQIGAYIYVFGNNNTNIMCYRYLAADLTGEQNMTIPTITTGGAVGAWTDGTYAYVVGSGSQTTSRKWSVSGTTFTAESTATVDTGIFAESDATNMWDGTTAYYASRAGVVLYIRKITAMDGTTYSTTLKTLPLLSDSLTGSFLIPIDSTKMYVGYAYAVYNASAKIATNIVLIPITKP